MDKSIVLIPALPLLGFLILFLFGRRLPRSVIPWIGAGSVCLAALLAIVIGIEYLKATPSTGALTQTLGHWFSLRNITCSFNFRVDALSMVFVFIITFVGALIHIYSAGFMKSDRD